MCLKAGRPRVGFDGGMTQSPHFQQLLQAAEAQAEPHRLLFVFAAAELPEHPTPEQRARFEAGQGGALTPLMCVDKAPAELSNFDALVAESRRSGPPWQVVFAAGLAGRDGRPPPPAQVDAALEKMVYAVRLGGVGSFAAFSASGGPLGFADAPTT
jgi:hypothetical protein